MNHTDKTILSIDNLSIPLPVGGDRQYAVENLSIDIHAGEILCIVGESGSGKSVTSFATMGLLPKVLTPSSGRIVFEGQDLLAMPRKARRRFNGDRLAMIFQEPMTALNPCYTIGNQVEEVFKRHRTMTAAERRQRTIEAFAGVKLPDPGQICAAYPHQLSGGQRQRVMIAMALALDPTLLLADEPTTALDVTTQAQILTLISELKNTHNAGIMFVTHDFGVVAEIADRVVVMRQGVVVEQGSADEVLNRPQHAYTRSLIDAVPRRATDVELYSEGDGALAALTVRALKKTFSTPGNLFRTGRTVAAVRGASFTVGKGETLGIVGESGSGKTTLVRCLIRLINPDSGEINVTGIDFAGLRPEVLREHRKDIQIVFQDPYGSLNPRRTVGDLIIEGPLNFGVSRDEALRRARALLKIVRLDPDCLDRYPSQFSGGQRQRICIARALALEPKVLIADEAVSALDVSVQKKVLELLAEIRDKFGLTVIFITHDLRVAAQICDNILVMKEGEIVERGSVDEVFGDPKHDYTRTLLAAEPGRDWKIPEFSGSTHTL